MFGWMSSEKEFERFQEKRSEFERGRKEGYEEGYRLGKMHGEMEGYERGGRDANNAFLGSLTTK